MGAVRGSPLGDTSGFVEQALPTGRDVILEIDVKGAEQVREKVPDAILIFLAPPVDGRAGDGGCAAAAPRTTSGSPRRLETAAWEMTQQGWFDHVVVNEDVVRAADEVAAIIDASRSGRSSDRAPGHPEET